ncbi:uncharacterized PKHD-type hydroxylase At1g22950 [Capsella rubella]|uniref:uncharacterized PKHD-type hydroxylase At1g22950 n=1 Tax=Capsella rubella TaxID=81985 RepID=UPI000CD53026|nr:uncharacterized PKHD-type hydroxylase At1g22950 [Capsella rubella]
MAVDGDGTDGGGGSQPPGKNAAEKDMEVRIPTLSHFPINDHVSDDYEDLDSEYSSLVLRSLEKYLPTEILTANRDEKAKFMSGILRKYISPRECMKVNWLKSYRQKIISKYRVRRSLFSHVSFWFYFDPEMFFLPAFLKVVRRIMSEPFPGLFVFQMFQRDFFEKLIVEAENFSNWAHENKFPIRRPYNKSKCSVVLEDFGLGIMLDKIMQDFIFPLCKGKSILKCIQTTFLVFFPDVCGAMFDARHGFYMETGEDKEAELGFHVDDSDITLNVCLRKQFEGGKMLFAGTRCNKHMDAEIKPYEVYHYNNTPGQAILHRGRNCHGSRVTATPGYRANMVLWYKSSLCTEMETYQKEFRDWCSQCTRVKKEKENEILAAKRQEMIRIEIGPNGRR